MHPLQRNIYDSMVTTDDTAMENNKWTGSKENLYKQICSVLDKNTISEDAVQLKYR